MRAYPILTDHDDDPLPDATQVVRQFDGFDLAMFTLSRLAVVFALGLALILTLAGQR